MELRKKLLGVASLAFACALSTGVIAVGANAETEWDNFAVSAVSIRLDDTKTEKVDSGIRFLVNCPVDYSESESVNAYTTLTFTSAAEGTVKQYTIDVPAKVWREDKSGWNTVLLDIPASDYVTEITAQSFVVINETEKYETAAKTTVRFYDADQEYE